MSPPATDAGRAVLLRRLGAATLDLLLGLGVALVAVALAPAYKANVFGGGLLVGGVYLLLRDALPFGERGARSLGKRALGVRPVREDGYPPGLGTSARRNAPLAALFFGSGLVYLFSGYVGFPFSDLFVWALRALFLAEVALILLAPAGRRLGDRLARTRVVEARFL